MLSLGDWLSLVWQPRCPRGFNPWRTGGFASSSFDEYAPVTGGNMHALYRRCNKLERFSVAKRYPVLISRICAGLVGAIALIAFANVCAYVYLKPALPDVDSLRDVQLQVPLRVYTRDGKLLAAIGEQRRIPVRYEQLPKKLIQAFLATEDDRFFRHHAGRPRHVPDAAARYEAQNERNLHFALDGGRVHQGRDFLAVRQQNLPRPARLRGWRRGGGVFRQELGPIDRR